GGRQRPARPGGRAGKGARMARGARRGGGPGGRAPRRAAGVRLAPLPGGRMVHRHERPRLPGRTGGIPQGAGDPRGPRRSRELDPAAAGRRPAGADRGGKRAAHPCFVSPATRHPLPPAAGLIPVLPRLRSCLDSRKAPARRRARPPWIPQKEERMWVSRNQASSTVRNGVQWVRLGDLLRAKGKSGSARPQENAAGGEMAAWRGEVLSLPLDRIWPNPYQPRREFSEEQLEELAASIREHGILHPVVVRPRDEGYELVVGERRYRACRLLGWERIPAVVRDLPDSEVAAIALIENLQRADISFFEEAEGCRRLL